MSERQTKGFGMADEKELFKLEQTEANAPGERQIVMEIGGGEGGKKIFLKKAANVTSLTGNFLVDTFQ